MSQALVEVLAARLSALRIEDLPSAVVHRATLAVLDTMGAMLAGSGTEEGLAVAGALVELDGLGRSSVFGSDVRLSPSNAAMANGTSAHARELDDFGGCGHSGAVVVPAVLAAAEATRAPGCRVIEAIVAGYEAAARVTEAAGGYRAHNDAGWHSTGTCGPFGAAAGVARVLGLDARASAHALGLAASSAAGTWAFILDGAMSKRIHPGIAARSGLCAAYLARHGVTGPMHVFEAEWGGFLGTYMPGQAVPDAITRRESVDDFRILRSGVKPYAACRGIHFVIDGLFEVLRQERVGRDEVSRLVVRCPTQTMQQLGKRDVVTTLDAQMSIPYSLAVALLTGSADLEQFAPERIADPEVRRLMERIELVEGPEMRSSERPWLTVETTAGARRTVRVEVARGDPAKPLSDEEIGAKFVGLARLALPPERVEALLETILGLPLLEDSTQVCRLATR
jgi:2-methylcitrate dehydratase PrpD